MMEIKNVELELARFRERLFIVGVCIGLAVLSFVGVGVMRWPLAWVLLGTGLLGCGWAYVQLARQVTAKEQA